MEQGNSFRSLLTTSYLMEKLSHLQTRKLSGSSLYTCDRSSSLCKQFSCKHMWIYLKKDKETELPTCTVPTCTVPSLVFQKEDHCVLFTGNNGSLLNSSGTGNSKT